MTPDLAASPTVSRREFLRTATMAAGTVCCSPSVGAAEQEVSPFIDTNVSIGAWPFRHESLADTPALVGKLREHKVTQAWTSSFDALLHKDIAQVNSRLAEDCRLHGKGILVPFGALNPMLSGWEADLRRCVEIHRMPGIRLHPNYHGYKPSDPVFESVLKAADESNLIVQIAVQLEDDRTLHPLVKVPPTDISPLPAILKEFPKLRVQLLNALRNPRNEAALTLAGMGVRLEIAMLEGTAGIASLLEKYPLNSICFGSHAPFYYFESAKLKLHESDLADVQLSAIRSGNATRWMR